MITAAKLQTGVLPPTTAELSQLLLLRGEDPENLRWLLGRCSVRQLPAGRVLLDPDRPNNNLYLILEGRVEVQLEARGHRAFAYLETGHCVGEMSIIERTQPSATVMTHTDCRLLVIEDDVLWSLINRSNAVARNLLHMLSSRVRKDNQLILESLQQQRLYQQDSWMDALTGLHNRRWLEEMLGRMLERCAINAQPLSLIMMDVDHFKNFNDTHGHLAGDRALSMIADVILRNIRPNDTAARYGGEEFIIIMPNTAQPDAHIVAERLCEAIRKEPLTRHDGTSLPGLTVSIGLASTSGNLNDRELISGADTALYRAKHAGRDRIFET